MNKESLEKLRYPIGKPKIQSKISKENITNWILVLDEFPEKLKNLVKNLSKKQLDTCYRKDGWTIRQVIHHCYDSHHNSYTRFKWAITENIPVIKTYNEAKWADLSDSNSAPITLSLNALKSLHAKWVFFLKKLNEEELSKHFIHPEGNEKVSLKKNIGIYAWHCNHHFAHIENLMIQKKWKK